MIADNLIKAVIFDFDGVIVNSVDAYIGYIQRILVKHGYRKPSEAEIRNNYWMPSTDLFRFLSGEKSDGKVLELYNDPEPLPDDQVRLVSDANEVLKRLSKSYKLAIVSSSNREYLANMLSANGIEKYFTLIITAEDAKLHKPNPESILLALSRLGIKPNEAVYIGDYPSDIEAGKAAGVMTVYLSLDPYGKEDARATTLKELPDIVEKLSSG